MTKRRLRRAILRLAVGMLLLLSAALAVPDPANSAAITGRFSVQLMISNVSASDTGVSYATISWETNGNADSQVYYDTVAHDNVTGYAYHTNQDPGLVSGHKVSLAGLSTSTTYHYRVKSIAIVDSVEIIATSEDYTFSTTARTGGGKGGDSTFTLTLTEVAGSTKLFTSTLTLDRNGTALSSGQLTTVDGKLTFNIARGTQLLDAQGQPLSFLSLSAAASGPPPPLLSAIVLTYDFVPAGATFVPPAKLTLKYDLATLPAGVLESMLYIAYWNGSQWQKLASTVETETRTVTAPVSHFTQFALIANLPAPALIPTPETTPATTPATIPEPPPAPAPPTTPLATPAPTPALTPLSSTAPAPLVPPAGGVVNWWLIGSGILAIIVISGVVWFLNTRRRT